VKGLNFEIARQRYWEMQKIDYWPGGSYPGATPYYEGTSTLAGAKVMQSLGYFTEYRWAFSIDETLLAIAHEGPVLTGIPWLDSMFEPNMDGQLDTSGREVGGHEIMWRGVTLPVRGVATVRWPDGTISKIKTSEPLVRCRNTWWGGPGSPGVWGRAGEAVVRASGLEALLKSDGDCCVPVGRKIP
jgi:hypothetical protein